MLFVAVATNGQETSEMLFDFVAANVIPFFLGASFTGGVVVFYLVMQRTRRKRIAEQRVA